MREKRTLLLQRVYLANHTVDIFPEVSRDYYPPTTPWYEFDGPFDWEFSQIGKVLKPGSRGSVSSVASMVDRCSGPRT